MYKGLGQPIISNIALEIGVLHIKSHYVIVVYLVKDPYKGIMSYNLIVYSV